MGKLEIEASAEAFCSNFSDARARLIHTLVIPSGLILSFMLILVGALGTVSGECVLVKHRNFTSKSVTVCLNSSKCKIRRHFFQKPWICIGNLSSHSTFSVSSLEHSQYKQINYRSHLRLKIHGSQSDVDIPKYFSPSSRRDKTRLSVSHSHTHRIKEKRKEKKSIERKRRSHCASSRLCCCCCFFFLILPAKRYIGEDSISVRPRKAVYTAHCCFSSSLEITVSLPRIYTHTAHVHRHSSTRGPCYFSILPLIYDFFPLWVVGFIVVEAEFDMIVA